MSEQAPVALTQAEAAQRYLSVINAEKKSEPPITEQAPPPEPQENEAANDAEGQAVETETTDETLEQEQGDESLYEVKINGKVEKITLDEALSGYQTAKASTQRFEEAAQMRREVETERTILSKVQDSLDEITQTTAYIEQAEQLIHALLPPPPSDDLLKTNPALYIKAKEARQAAEQQVYALRGGLEQAKARQAQLLASAQAHAQIMLKAEMPEVMTDEGAGRLIGYLSSLGFAESQIKTAADHRLFVMAEKARRYDELMSKPPEKARPAPKVTSSKPTARPSGDPRQGGPSFAKALDKVKNTGSQQDAAAAYLALRNRNKT